MAAALIPLLLGVVGVLFVVLMGWLFKEFSKPGQRLVPMLIIFTGLAFGVILFFLKLKAFAVIAVVAIVAIGYITAATAPDRPVEQPGQKRRPEPRRPGQPESSDEATGSS